MEAYIGTKIIEAEECTAPGNVKGENKPGDAGYKVRYEDGYESWSPKGAFERAYRKLSSGETTIVVGF